MHKEQLRYQSKCTVKDVFLCQEPFGEAAYGQGDSRLVQQSQRWLGNQSRWSKWDADGNIEVIKCHWKVLGRVKGLFSAWVTDGRLSSGVVVDSFKRLWSWLRARWNSCAIPLLWAATLMFHRIQSSLVNCGFTHKFLSLSFFKEGDP